MKKSIYILLILFVQSAMSVFAQKGDFFITHYTAENEQIENENFAISQDYNGQIYAANRRGVLKFDGVNWQLIKTSTTAMAIASDKLDKNVYVGCLDGFGLINTDNAGNEQYNAILTESNKYLSISKIIVLRKFVYFMGDGIVYKFSKKDKKITNKWQNNATISIDNMFEYLDEAYISDKSNGIFRFINDQITKISLPFPANEKVVCAIPAQNNTTLLFTDNNTSYVYSGYRLEPYKLEDQKYINESVINEGIALSNDLAAIATNRGGCLIFNTKTGKTTAIANYYSGLPDNEVFAICKDAQSGIWIAHEFGFSRIDYELPLRTYSNYVGLEGHLESAISFNEKLYVATSEGVYYLTETQNTSQIVQYIQKANKKNKSDEETKEGKLNETIEKQKEKVEKIKRFLGIFKRKAKEEKEAEEAKDAKEKIKEQPQTNNKNPKNSTKLIAIKKTVVNPGIGSIKYYFKKIEGIDSKCTQILAWGNKLLVASNNGIYEIVNDKSKKIHTAFVNYMYLSKNQNKLYIGTKDSKFIGFNINNNELKVTDYFKDYNDDIINICESDSSNLWVSSSYYVYKFKLDKTGNIAKKDTFLIQNPYSDDINLVFYENKLMAITSTDIYVYDVKTNKLQKDTTTGYANGKYFRLIHTENNKLWINEAQKWQLYSNPKLDNLNLSFLNLMSDIQDITIDNKTQICWVITQKGLLCQFDTKASVNTVNGTSLFLNYIESANGRSAKTDNMIIQEHKSSVSFNYIIPEYLDGKLCTFSYKLKNVDSENEIWSPWDANNKISFSHLQSGSYQLAIRSKNTLGQIAYSNPIYFEVKPPYWQTWWFYLLEVTFFATLLFLSIFFNRIGGEQKTVSKILTFVTIVMFVELITSIVESFVQIDDSPVLSFATKVTIAIVIFPIEQVLYRFILKKAKDNQTTTS